MIWQYSNASWQHLKLHDIYNVPAFIVCSGQSLNQVGDRILTGPGRVVIGVNNSYPRVRPDIWCGMDYPECYDNRVFYEPFIKVMRGSLSDISHDGKMLRDYNAMAFARVDQKQSFWDYSNTTSAVEWNNNSFTITLQLALWMGIRRFYFVGVDFDTKNSDYYDDTKLTKEQRSYNTQLYGELYDRMKNEIIYKFLDLGIYCVSCSDGSKINNIMPFQSIDDAIRDCESGIKTGRQKVHGLDSRARAFKVS